MLNTRHVEASLDLGERYRAELHKPCPAPRKRRITRECEWGPSLYCKHCGRPIPSLIPGAPGEIK